MVVVVVIVVVVAALVVVVVVGSSCGGDGSSSSSVLTGTSGLLAYIHSFIPMAYAGCHDSLPFSGPSSIPVYYDI